MGLTVQRLSDTVSVASQMTPEDLAAIAAAGYKSIIINRPDYEAGPDQPTAQQMIETGQALGLDVVYQPVISGAMTQADVDEFGVLIEKLPTPILAYCRTGTRCTVLYRAATGV